MAKRIEKIAREAISSKKYKAGTREVMNSVKGSKLIIISESMEEKVREKLQSQAASSNIPLYHFKGSALQLARLCGMPYKVSTISLKAVSTEDIDSVLQDKE